MQMHETLTILQIKTHLDGMSGCGVSVNSYVNVFQS